MSYTWPDAAEWRSRRRCREARARRAAERQPEPEDGLPWSARTRSGDAWTLGYYGALRKGGASLQACVLVLLFAAVGAARSDWLIATGALRSQPNH